jgi:hypothetical protein
MCTGPASERELYEREQQEQAQARADKSGQQQARADNRHTMVDRRQQRAGSGQQTPSDYHSGPASARELYEREQEERGMHEREQNRREQGEQQQQQQRRQQARGRGPLLSRPRMR